MNISASKTNDANQKVEITKPARMDGKFRHDIHK